VELIIPALACLSIYLAWRTYLESKRPRIPDHDAIPLILAAIQKNQQQRLSYTRSLQSSQSRRTSSRCCFGGEGETCLG